MLYICIYFFNIVIIVQVVLFFYTNSNTHGAGKHSYLLHLTYLPTHNKWVTGTVRLREETESHSTLNWNLQIGSGGPCPSAVQHAGSDGSDLPVLAHANKI